MAIISGMICMNCEKKPARHDSHFCSDGCGDSFAHRMQGPVQCDCGTEVDDARDARRAGWKKLRPDPEGISYNYAGVCPECVKGASVQP